MLTIYQVRLLSQYGVEVVFRKKAPASDPYLKGEYNPETLEAIIYLQNVHSSRDLGITLLHEFIHATDDLRWGSYMRQSERLFEAAVSRYEEAVEQEAVAIYTQKPHILTFIKSLYSLK